MIRSRFARRSMPALLLTVFLTACGGSTGAPAVDPKLLQERVDQFVASITKPDPASEFTATAAGAAKVETKDDGTVIATLPRLTFVAKEGNTAILDPVTLRFSNGGEGLVNFEAAIPSSMQVKDKAGKVEGEIKIGSQTLKGIWVEKLQTVDQLDMRLSNLTITSPTEPGSGKIDQIVMTGALSPKGGGVYDAKYEMTVNGFYVDDPTEKTQMKMGSIGVVATMTGTKLEAWAKAAKEAGYTLANPDLFKVWTGGPIDPKMITFMKAMPQYMGAIDYVYSLDGIEMVQDGKTQFALKNTSLGFGVAADGQGTTKVRVGLGLGGMSGETEMLPPEADIQDASLEITATGVPGQKLWDIYMDALPALQAEAAKMASETAKGEDATATSTAALETMGAQLSGRFLEVMTAAKLAVALNKLNLVTPTAKITGNGMASYLPAESMLPTGTVTLRFSGIDALATAMKKRPADDTMRVEILGNIDALRAMGRRDPASTKDDPAYIIDIKFEKDGRITANGKDLMTGQ